MSSHNPPMRRISVVGTSGSGKSTLARELARRLAIPFVELDAFMHQPGWEPRPADEFMADVEGASAEPSWVIEGNYREVVMDGPVWRRADTVVWLDLPRRTVMRQVIGRTIRRAVTRQELWNGNREPLTNFLSLDPFKNIILWAWVKHDEFAERYSTVLADPAWRHLRFVRLRSRGEAARWLGTLDSSA